MKETDGCKMSSVTGEGQHDTGSRTGAWRKRVTSGQSRPAVPSRSTEGKGRVVQLFKRQ